jgi:hypothetical protein
VRATAGELVSARAEADLDEALGTACRGDVVGIVTRSGGLQPLLPRHPTALVGAEAEDVTVEIRSRRARSRSTGVSVEALVGREGATSAAPRRGVHRCRRLPRQTRLLVAAVGAVVALAGTATVALMSDLGASVPTVIGQDRAETPRLDMPSARPFESADEAEQEAVSPDQPTALHRLAHAMPDQRRPTAVPTEHAGPTRSPDLTPSHRATPEPEPKQDAEPTQDAEPAQEADGTSPGRSEGAESRGNADRGRDSDARSGGAGRRD